MIFPISSIGSIAPISLFTIITDTRIVSGQIACFNSSGSICPCLSTFRNVIRNPCSSRNSNGLYTDACSILVDMIWFPLLRFAKAAPISAMLLDSVPPEVNMISFGSAFSVPAMMSCASFIYCSASAPFRCLEDGLP